MGENAMNYTDTFDFACYEADGFKLNYRIHMPENGITENAPMVLFLHGAGERGDDNCLQLRIGLDVALAWDESPLHNAVIIAPQVARDDKWVRKDWEMGNYDMSTFDESPWVHYSVELVQKKAEELGCDKKRIYIMGISMGGFGTWYTLAKYPEIFAAGFPCCGAGDPRKADILKEIPIFTYHGEVDDVVPVTGTREMVEAIKAAGGTKIQYKEYPGVNHWSWDAAYGEKEDIAAMFRIVKQ